MRYAREMSHARGLVGVLALALVGSLMVGCTKNAKQAAPSAQATAPITQQAAPPLAGHQIIVYVTPDPETPNSTTCQVSMDPVHLSIQNKDYVTWELLGHKTGNKHTVKFDTTDGTPCDSQDTDFDMTQGAAQSKNCTIQSATAGKTYKYSIYKNYGNPKKLCDPSVGIDP